MFYRYDGDGRGSLDKVQLLAIHDTGGMVFDNLEPDEQGMVSLEAWLAYARWLYNLMGKNTLHFLLRRLEMKSGEAGIGLLGGGSEGAEATKVTVQSLVNASNDSIHDLHTTLCWTNVIREPRIKLVLWNVTLIIECNSVDSVCCKGKRVFHLLDVDGSTSLDSHELEFLWTSFDMNEIPADLLATLGTDFDGAVDISSWLKLLANIEVTLGEEMGLTWLRQLEDKAPQSRAIAAPMQSPEIRATRLFYHLDRNRDSLLDESELGHVIAMAGKGEISKTPLSLEEWQQFVNEYWKEKGDKAVKSLLSQVEEKVEADVVLNRARLWGTMSSP